jgi:hypothetical protein
LIISKAGKLKIGKKKTKKKLDLNSLKESLSRYEYEMNGKTKLLIMLLWISKMLIPMVKML